MKKILNYTPHCLNVVNVDGNSVAFASAGLVRVGASSVSIDNIDGFDIVKTSYSEVIGLPAQIDDTFLVVSRLVFNACPDRTDLLCPGDLLRDSAGNVIGCKGFSI